MQRKRGKNVCPVSTKTKAVLTHKMFTLVFPVNILMDRKKIYWSCQVLGWFLFVLINSLFIKLSGSLNNDIVYSLLILMVLGVTVSHIYRNVIVNNDWLRLNAWKLLPRVILSTILFGACLHFIQLGIEKAIGIRINQDIPGLVETMANILNMAFVFFFWSLIYFLAHYVENYKKAEIENLKWQAAINEIELNKLKSQLNPHFMFNAMNSIRALISEDPARAKTAVTQLSNILRNTLAMGKNKVIPFSEEMKIVKDYIDLETVRYEERLKVDINIGDLCEPFNIPPLMIQTLVENGIKHGISKLPQGGTISIHAHADAEQMHIVITNSGQIQAGNETGSSGFGLLNTRQRLELLFGNEAKISVSNLDDGHVITTLIIPKNLKLYTSDQTN